MMLKPLMGCNGPLVWTDTQLPTAALREGYPTGSRTTRSRQILAEPDSPTRCALGRRFDGPSGIAALPKAIYRCYSAKSARRRRQPTFGWF